MKMKGAAPPPRVVIENVRPSVDEGSFPIKRTVGEKVRVTADIFADGHDLLGAVVSYRRASESEWSEIRMEPIGNDRWAGEFTVSAMEPHFYTVQGW
ncbi:MAG: maltotransferase domain-containing protein, partial [Terriglobales bacterium]